MPHAARNLAALTALVMSVAAPTASGERTVLIIGDSLSREYQFEFPGFEAARNWVEILAAHRATDFDFGEESEFEIPGLSLLCDIFGGDLCEALGDGEEPLRRFRYNWAIPTFTADAYRDNLAGSGLVDQAFQELIEPDFEVVDTVVIFIGGNDFDAAYEGVYDGTSGAADALVADLSKDLRDIVDYVSGQNGDLEIVLVNVPHVGATPEVKGDHPTHPVRTARATDALNRLNAELAGFAARRGIAYADIASFTIDLIEPDIYCIGGIEFFNAGSDTGATEFIWLGGQLSQNFHPNTAGQALVANAIIAALNTTYGAGVAPLGTREILEDILGLDADMPFADWVAAFGLPSGQEGPNDDPEKDGVQTLVEFALDLHPGRSDAHLLPEPLWAGGDLTLTYRPRDAACEYVRIRGEASADLASWVPAGEPIANGDGTWTVATALPYLRLWVEVVE